MSSERDPGPRAMGRRLPRSYRGTAALFGLDDGGLLASLHGAFGQIRTVPELLALYDDDAGFEATPVVLGAHIGVYLAFDMTQGDEADAPVVLEGTATRYADRWETLVLHQAVAATRAWTAASAWWTSSSPRSLGAALARVGASIDAELDAVSRAYGLRGAWFDDAQHRTRVGSGITLQVSLHHGAMVTVSGDDGAVTEALANELAERLGGANAAREFQTRW